MKRFLFFTLLFLLKNPWILHCQTPDTYLTQIQELCRDSVMVNPGYIMDECERFLSAYPLHEHSGQILEYRAKYGVQANETKPIEAALLFSKASSVYLFDIHYEQKKDDYESLLNAKEGLLRKTKLNDSQKNLLRQMMIPFSGKSEIHNRCFQFIRKLCAVRDKNIHAFIEQEIEWFMQVFPESKEINQMRFWLAGIHADQGHPLLAAGYYSTIAHGNTQDTLAPHAALLAADVYCQFPICEYNLAIFLLKWYLDTYPKTTWRPALERLTTILSTKKYLDEDAAVYCRELLEEYSDSLQLDIPTLKSMFKYFGKNKEENYADLLGTRFIQLYPDNRFVKDIDSFSLEFRESNTPIDTRPYRQREIEPIVLNMPEELSTRIKAWPTANIQELVSFLIKDVDDPFMKMKIIHDWICYHIEYDYSTYCNISNKQSASLMSVEFPTVLRRGKTVCAGYSRLFEKMATLAGFRAFYITGRSKGLGWSLTGKEGKHAWNAVKIDRTWYLIDCTWDAGYGDGNQFTRDYSTAYFLLKPEQIILSHFPDDSKWQLMDEPIDFKTFKSLQKPNRSVLEKE